MAERNPIVAVGTVFIPEKKTDYIYVRDDGDVARVRLDNETVDFFPANLNPRPQQMVSNDLDAVRAFVQLRSPNTGTIARGVTVKADYNIPTGLGNLTIPRSEERQVTIFQPPTLLQALVTATFPGRVIIRQQNLGTLGNLPAGVRQLREGDDVIGISIEVMWKVTGFFAEKN